MAETFELEYFDLRGLAEPTRIMFAIAGQKYRDLRLPIDVSNFSKPEFDANAAAGKYSLNMDRVPILSYTRADGNILNLGGSKAIDRFVAKKLGFFGSTDEEAAVIDQVCEHCRDIRDKYTSARAGKKDAELEEAKKMFLTAEFPKWMTKLEKCMAVPGGKVSLADIYVWSLVEDYFDDKDLAVEAIQTLPKIKGAVQSVSSAAADWIKTRPVTKF